MTNPTTIFADRVAESTTTTGTGAITLGGALTGFRAFSTVCSVGNVVYYSVWSTDGSGNATGPWETGYGTYSATNTLTRTTPISGSGTTPVSLTGTSYVTISPIASQTPQIGPDNGITLPTAGTGSPFTPPANSGQVFMRNIASRQMLASIGPSGLDYACQPFIARNHIGIWCPPGGAATAPGVNGITALTASGTLTTRTVVQGALATNMRRAGYPGAATAGSVGGARMSTATINCGSGTANDGSGFFFVERFVESDPAPVSGRIEFCGLSTNTSAPNATTAPNTLTNSLGIIQISTDATQYYWYMGGSTAAFIDTGIGIGAPAGNSTTAWELAIFAPNSVANTYYCQLTNLTTGVIATTTMTATTAVDGPQTNSILAWRHFTSNNATALATGVDFVSIYIETDY